MKHKILGQVFTSEWIVNLILDELDYNGSKILSQKIIDPACGDGAFLVQVVDRLIYEAKKAKKSNKEIKEILENSVYGIELDKEAYEKCLANLNNKAINSINLKVTWKVYNSNSLIKYKEFCNLFDYVVGNPPYIRIHNLDLYTRNLIKNNFKFNKGILDIYLAFFELGLELLNKNGKLGYITPNSFLRNSSYKDFRKYLKENRNIKTIIDFKSNKIFKKFSTYTAITVIDLSKKRDKFDYKELRDGKIKKINEIEFSKLDNKSWSFSNKNDMLFLEKLYEKYSYKVSDFFEVQYGFATLRDKIFIGKIEDEKEGLVLFNNFWVEKALLKKIVKGSTYKGNEKEIRYIIFPYKRSNNRFAALSEKELRDNFPKGYEYLLFYKDELLKRDIEKNRNWYEFGRSQGLQNCHKEKIVVSNLFDKKVNFYFLSPDIYVYSGIFITKKRDCKWDLIVNVLSSKEFERYIKIKGKDLSGGYKSITSKLIKEFPIL